ncbi:hypothetical protein [Propionivibrio sp.]|uniref:hypothetical protein n=1 Tax=Propionivibrio sp. TaxID=2212460 RepID=UPI00272ED534|nr:hypothetical protein [Propionivibrio sp.]
MALLGKAAMILAFDIAPEAIVEHDNWHSLEHLNERMSIPGFLRGSRWTNLGDGQRYFVMYEVADLDTLASKPYLEQLNNPSPWTSRMMPHYRGMNRGFCRVAYSQGFGLGTCGLLIRLSPDPEQEAALRDWLVMDTLPALPGTPGLTSAHLFEAALTPEMTQEQRIRGKDSGVDWVVLVTGYDEKVVGNLAVRGLALEEIEAQGGINVVSGVYRMGHSLSERETTA